MLLCAQSQLFHCLKKDINISLLHSKIKEGQIAQINHTSLSVFVIAATTLVVKPTNIPGFEEYCPDNWCWDRDHKSCDVQLSTNQLAAYFHTGIKISTFSQSACQ